MGAQVEGKRKGEEGVSQGGADLKVQAEASSKAEEVATAMQIMQTVVNSSGMEVLGEEEEEGLGHLSQMTGLSMLKGVSGLCKCTPPSLRARLSSPIWLFLWDPFQQGCPPWYSSPLWICLLCQTLPLMRLDLRAHEG